MARFLVAHFGLSTTMIAQPANARLAEAPVARPVEPQNAVRITWSDGGTARLRPGKLFRRF